VAATANRADVPAVARAWAAGAPDNGFAPAVAGLDAAEWEKSCMRLLVRRRRLRSHEAATCNLAGTLGNDRGAPRARRAPTEPALDVGVDEKLGQTIPLDIKLVDEQGDRVALRDLIDKPTLLTLNYFRCVGLCTPLLNGVAEMLQKIDQIPGKDFQILTVSFDPRDDAELAGHKKENYIKQLGPAFPPTAWRFLTGDPVSTKRLADSVGFKFAKSRRGLHPSGRRHGALPHRHGDALPLRGHLSAL
jgi:cytochrome oxidase Cu insertion factor (SCO1/SenC/PrrC family)